MEVWSEKKEVYRKNIALKKQAVNDYRTQALIGKCNESVAWYIYGIKVWYSKACENTRSAKELKKFSYIDRLMS